MSLVICFWRMDLKLWVYKRFGIRFCHLFDDSTDHEKFYDAFVIYSNRDNKYAKQVFIESLELGDKQYRICLHQTDPSHSVSFPMTQACVTAKRTILFISKNFLQQEWKYYEFQTGLLECVYALRKRLIVVLFQDIKYVDLDSQLRSAISTATTIQWKDHNFWDKLKFYLPEVEESFGISQSTTLNSYPSILNSITSSIYQTPDIYVNPTQCNQAGAVTSKLHSIVSPEEESNTNTCSHEEDTLIPSSLTMKKPCLKNPYASIRLQPFVHCPKSTLPTPTNNDTEIIKGENDRLFTISTSSRQDDHIYQVCI